MYHVITQVCVTYRVITQVCVMYRVITGVLAEWIERRLEQVREMAAELNDSESDVDTVELSSDDDDDVQTARELFISC